MECMNNGGLAGLDGQLPGLDGQLPGLDGQLSLDGFKND